MDGDVSALIPTLSTLAIFIGASLVLLLTPGPAVVYIVARGVSQGWRAGVTSALAVGGGNFVHALAATAGLSALLVASAEAFTIVKWAGAAYLVWIGVRTLLGSDTKSEAPAPPIQPLSRIARQGFVVAVLNPKTAIFFLAFVPQFVNPSHGPVAWQFLILGTLFAILGIVTDSAYGVLAGALQGLVTQRRAAQRPARLATGTLYLGLGVSAALAEPPR